ncbi:hypothetical protein ABT040_29870 [Streptomyces sp. NPDC002688]|uniref:hypothetical protein n=1 Tax=Streptomyces sp. NPDC002688 TaxID=3154423 RepID=UPI00332DD0A2
MIEEGPALSLASELATESYVVATVTLEPNGSHTVPLVPQDATPVLLAVQANTASGSPTTVSILSNPSVHAVAQGASRTEDDTAHEASEDGWIKVEGTLLINGADVLKGLGTPRSLSIKNTTAEPATVDILSCLDLP